MKLRRKGYFYNICVSLLRLISLCLGHILLFSVKAICICRVFSTLDQIDRQPDSDKDAECKQLPEVAKVRENLAIYPTHFIVVYISWQTGWSRISTESILNRKQGRSGQLRHAMNESLWLVNARTQSTHTYYLITVIPTAEGVTSFIVTVVNIGLNV